MRQRYAQRYRQALAAPRCANGRSGAGSMRGAAEKMSRHAITAQEARRAVVYHHSNGARGWRAEQAPYVYGSAMDRTTARRGGCLARQYDARYKYDEYVHAVYCREQLGRRLML